MRMSVAFVQASSETKLIKKSKAIHDQAPTYFQIIFVVRDQVNQKIESNSRLLKPLVIIVGGVRDQVNQKIESNSRCEEVGVWS